MYITARHIAFYAYLPKKAVSNTLSSESRGSMLTLSSPLQRTRLQSRAICPSAASETQSTTATGSASRATSSPTTVTRRISTSPAVRLTCATASRPTSPTRTRKGSTSPSSPTSVHTTSGPTARRAPRSGSKASSGSFSDHTTTAIASRSRSLSRMSSTSRRYICWTLPRRARSASSTMTRPMLLTRYAVPTAALRTC